MSTVEQAETVGAGPLVTGRPGAAFWVCRYLPAEVAGTAALILAGVAVTYWTSIPAVIALAALIGECVGFYGVLAVTLRLDAETVSAGRPPTTARLLAAEFGTAEAIDTFFVRPAALVIGIALVGDPVVGLIAGKIVADVVFYTAVSRSAARSGGARVEERAS